MKLELLYGAITRLAPYLCTGARYSPKCELASFHWKQSWAWREPKRLAVYVSAVCSLFWETRAVAPRRPLARPGIQWDTICFAAPHECLCGTSLWKGEGQVAWKLAAGVSIRSNYWLHRLGSFPAFWTSEVIWKSWAEPWNVRGVQNSEERIFICIFFLYELTSTAYVGDAGKLLQDKSMTFESEVLYYWQHAWEGSTKSQIGKGKLFSSQSVISAVEWSKRFVFQMGCLEEIKKIY